MSTYSSHFHCERSARPPLASQAGRYSTLADGQPRSAAFRAGVLCGALLCGSIAVAQPASQGVLLIKGTEAVLHGQIVQRGEIYEVQIATQSRVSIPADRVAAVGRSTEELYQFKCRGIAAGSVGDHFQMTRWCLRNGLLVHAAEHYSEVAKQHAAHPRVKQLAVELETRLLAEPEFRAFLGLSPQTYAAAGPPSAEHPVPADVRAAGGGSEVDLAPHPEILRRFVERVQPILINRCSQAACHGVHGTSRLRLLEPYARSPGPTNSENLRQVLLFSFGEAGQGPPLLEFAARPHGIQTAAAISAGESHLWEELRDWIHFVQNPVVPAIAIGPGGAEEVMPAGRTSLPGLPTSPPLRPVQSDTPRLRQVPRTGGINASPALPTAQPAAVPAAPQPDPFDPDEFNRRTQPERAASEAASASRPSAIR